MFLEFIANRSYVLFLADVPGGMNRGAHGDRAHNERTNQCWNAIAKAVEICTDIGILAITGGFC